MPGLESLVVSDFRNIAAAEIHLSPSLTVVEGANAAGKTSLLEAIHVLARARSFQRIPGDRLIRRGCERLLLHGRTGGGEPHRLGLERSRERMRVRLDSVDVRSLSEVAWLLPVQVINTQSQRFLTDGPADRRAFLNWGMFHVEHGFRTLWRRYERALRQRNAALRQGDRRTLAALEPDFVTSAEAVHAGRQEFITRLLPYWTSQITPWLPDPPLAWRYRRGWPEGQSLVDTLERASDRETALGYTLHGPHRADLRLTVEGEDAGQQLSRGQQKIVVVALRLALVRLLGSVQAETPLLLVDDLAAELDEHFREAVLTEALNVGSQVVVTCIDRTTLPQVDVPARWFHVEQGRFVEVI